MNIAETKPDLIHPHLLNRDGIQAWFTLKNASLFSDDRTIPGLNIGLNTSEKAETIQKNRSLLLNTLNIQPDWIAYGEQVHSNRIQLVSEGGTYIETDGLITRISGLALAIQVADCAAVLLGDAQHRIIAAVHAGWRGASVGILPGTIRKMVKLGADPKCIKVFVSPCISEAQFEVGEEVAGQFPGRFVDYESFEKPHVDLKGFLTYQLLECGVKSLNIEVHDGCTVRDKEQFYSYRREKEQSGRMLGVIQLL